MTRLWAEQLRNCGSILPHSVMIGCGAHPVSWALSLRVRRLVREIDHSLQPDTEAENEWSYAATPPICFHGVHKDTFTFAFTVAV